MAQVEITAGKIKNADFCEYSYDERVEGGSQAVSVSSDAIIHDDMRYAFRQLVPHLAYICEEIGNSNDLDTAMTDMKTLNEESPVFEKLTAYKVTAFKLGGSGDGQGVTITGQKRLKTGKVVNLNTPFMKWEDEYDYINELRVAINACQSEVVLYSDGKKAPEAQMSLFDGGDDDLDEVFQEE